MRKSESVDEDDTSSDLNKDLNILFLPGNKESGEILSKYLTIPRVLIWTNGLNKLNQNINSN